MNINIANKNASHFSAFYRYHRYLGFSIFVQNHVCPVGPWSDLHVSRIFGYLSFIFLYIYPFLMVVPVRIALFNSILRHWFSVLHVFQQTNNSKHP